MAMRHALKLHPDSRSKSVTAITVEVKRSSIDTIELYYVAEGDISRVAVPSRAVESMHVDELWRHTCFEAFVREPTAPSYVEFNFSPSTEYAGYSFTGYREGMHGTYCTRPVVAVNSTSKRLELRATIWMRRIPQINIDGPLRLGLSAIIEETDGSKSWWALAHPQGKPDFHHADSFVLDLPPEQT